MRPFGCPLGTFLAYVASFATVVAALVWSINDARKGREE